ncbi:MAG: PKD domain-containing protein, partial [Cytophagaceae bacterium]
MKRVFILILIACVTRVFGQCPSPRLMDQNMVASQKPLYINKIVNETDPDTFLLTIYSPKDINNYSIDFGDGTTITGALWKAGIPVSHSYTIGKFTLTLLESMNGCTGKVSGMVINDRKPGATAIPPTLNISGCVPHALTFVNNTTNASPMTKFRWEWGDGTIDMQDASGIGQPISHTYLSAKGGCGKVVKITAISLSDSSFATYGPYDFWDVDVTIVKASAVNICAGQLLSFYDSTKYNCNKSNRYIQWDFSEAGGPVTSWLPNTPQNKIRKNIIDGTAGQSYTIYLSDSNSCGIKKSSVKVNIINSPTAVIRASSQTICTGQTIQFTNTSFGGANLFHWDFGDGTGWTTVKTMAPINHRYIKSGIFKVRLVSEITGAPSCSDTASLTIESISLPQVHFSMDKREGCGSLQVNLTNLTVNGVIWEWYLDNALISQANTPPALNFNMPGVHEIRLKSTNKAGCSAMSSSAVFIYPEINVDASIENSCAGTPVKLTNLSSFTSAMPKGGILREQYDSPSKPYLLNSISNIGGIADISGVLYSFETVNNPGIDYASRMRAFIYPPISGNYTFWLAADTIAELWLSTGDSTSGKRKIAFTEASTGFRTIGAYATQQSSPIYLEAGKYYYVEALTRKDRQFNDYLSVGWTIPDGRIDMPIPGQYLAPFSTGWNLSQYIWSFNNGETSLQNNPYYTFASPGLYSVTLYEGSAKCSAAKTFLAKVNPSSKTDFELSDTAGCTPFKFTLTNRSSNATKSFIYFSDSSQLSQNNQWSAFDHTFTNNSRSAKKYFIKMVTESPDGCLDSLTKYVTVYPGPDADFSYQLTNGHCSPVGLSLQNLSSGSSAYHWNFGNGDTLSSTLSFLNYKLENKTGHIIYDTITLRAYSATGCYTESREVIEVFPEPAIAIYSSDSACHLQPVQFSADPLLSDLHWTFGDSLVSQKSPSFSFKNYGNTAIDYKIQLKATSVFGCT